MTSRLSDNPRRIDSAFATAGAALLQSAIAFGLQLELLRRFASDPNYLSLLTNLNIFLPIGMMIGSSAGLILAREVGTGLKTQSSGAVWNSLRRFLVDLALLTALLSVANIVIRSFISGEVTMQRIATAVLAAMIAWTTTAAMTLAPIASARGRHMLSVSIPLIPSLFALCCILADNAKIGVFAYPLGWIAGMALSGAVVIIRLFPPETRTNPGIPLRPIIWQSIISSPSFLIFGIHQFLDGAFLARQALLLLPTAGFLQRLIVSTGNITAAGFLSHTISDFAHATLDDMNAAMDRLRRRRNLMILFGAIMGALGTFANACFSDRIGALADALSISRDVFHGVPLYMAGGSIMIATAMTSRALILMGHKRIFFQAGGAMALTYCIIMAILVSDFRIYAVGIAYTASWAAGLLILYQTLKTTVRERAVSPATKP